MSFQASALVSGQDEMQDRGGIEDVPAAGLNRRHAAKEVGIPERQAAERPDVLDEELAEHDAGGDGVLAHQHLPGPLSRYSRKSSRVSTAMTTNGAHRGI